MLFGDKAQQYNLLGFSIFSLFAFQPACYSPNIVSRIFDPSWLLGYSDWKAWGGRVVRKLTMPAVSSLTAILGPVGAGKTKLLNKISKKLCVPVFIPRYATLFKAQKPNPLCCYDGEAIENYLVLDTADDLRYMSRKCPVVILDEFLFWAAKGDKFSNDPDDEQFFYKKLLQYFENKKLIIATFDTDPYGQEFIIIPYIKVKASEVVQLTTPCYYCGGVGRYSYKATGKKEIAVGDLGANFVAVCSTCLVQRAALTSFAG